MFLFLHTLSFLTYGRFLRVCVSVVYNSIVPIQYTTESGKYFIFALEYSYYNILYLRNVYKYLLMPPVYRIYKVHIYKYSDHDLFKQLIIHYTYTNKC